MAFEINPDIRKAYTLPASFYRDQTVYNRLIDKVFCPSWQFVGTQSQLQEKNYAYPFVLLEDCLDEPLILTKDDQDVIKCLSNVCTHRGNIIVEKAGPMRKMQCRYHGRCFNMDGSFLSMPEFKEALDFPSLEDHLPQLAVENVGELLFTSIDPAVSFDTIFGEIKRRLHWFPFDQLTFDASSSQDYYVDANWALYCDNYLEGFHVPFVHGALNKSLDYGSYSTHIYDYCNLQLGIAKEGEQCFDLPKDSEDYGQNIYAFYYWVYPNMMFNFYPWGLSLNIIEPKGYNKTKMIFQTYLLPGFTTDDFSQNCIHETEMEDEEVVRSVFKGIHSRLYKRGRFSPKREKGVHHFHSLIAEALSK